MRKKELTFQNISPELFEEIYKDMLEQFASYELKTEEKFRKLLATKEYLGRAIFCGKDIVGYVFYLQKGNYIWIEYLAILKKYHSQGFGSSLFDSLKNVFTEAKGCFLEVELPNPDVPNTLRRIAFYERLGALLLDVDYIFPHDEIHLPMRLYFMPFGDSQVLPSRQESFDMIKKLFDLVHNEVRKKDKIYNKIVSS